MSSKSISYHGSQNNKNKNKNKDDNEGCNNYKTNLINLIIDNESQPSRFYPRQFLLNFFQDEQQNFSCEKLEKILEMKVRFRTEHSKLFDSLVNKEADCTETQNLEKLACNITYSNSTRDDVLSNISLVRYLIARNQNVEQALNMMVEYLNYRDKNNLDNILKIQTNNSILQNFFDSVCPYLTSVDKMGRCVYWQQQGKINVPELCKVVSVQQLVNHHMYTMERQIFETFKQTEKESRIVYQFALVMDMSGLVLNLDNRGLQVFKGVNKIDQNFYPERLGNLFFINAPQYFRTLQMIIRSQLTPRTRSKFHVLGKNFLPTLLEYIDIDQIPSEYCGDKSVLELPVVQSVKNAARAGVIPDIQEQNAPEYKTIYCAKETNSNFNKIHSVSMKSNVDKTEETTSKDKEDSINNKNADSSNHIEKDDNKNLNQTENLNKDIVLNGEDVKDVENKQENN